MLFINDQWPQVRNAKNLHDQMITCFLYRRLYGNVNSSRPCPVGGCAICKSKTRKIKINRKLYSILNRIEIYRLAGAKPAELEIIHKKFNRLCKIENLSKLQLQDLKKIFDYDWFCKKNNLYTAYDLCEKLAIETCIYCNRLYTSTVINDKKKKIVRPTLDHWFPQETHPLLALSFYNLIPACSPCNTAVKHEAKFSLKKHLHPYIDQDITKQYQLVSSLDSFNTYKIKVKSANKKIKTTLTALCIEDIYEAHQSELTDLEFLRKKYNKTYLDNVGKLLNAKLSEEEVYRYLFGVEYLDQDFYKRPLSKLKKDILTRKGAK